MAKKKAYSKKELKKFKQLIEKKLKRTKKELKSLKGHQVDQKKYIAQSDMSFSDDTRRFENKAIMDSMLTRWKRKNKKLKAALGRIENGTYGICKRTGNLIGKERLEAIPTSVYSMPKKQLKKKKKK